MRFMLDTNTCIYIINHRPPQVRARFTAHPPGDVGISSITAAELTFSVERSGSARNRAALEKFLWPLEIADFDLRAAWRYGTVRAELKGTPIGALDTLIAAHALSLDLTLVTQNTRDFERVPGLVLQDWLA